MEPEKVEDNFKKSFYMEEKIPHRIFPKKIKFILAVLLSLFLLSLTLSEVLEIREGLKSKETIVFSGEGKVIGIPDIAQVSFSVITEGITAKEVMTENAKKMNEVIKFIKESGVDEKDVKTQSYLLNPRYDYLEGKRVFRGYELNSTLAVKIRNLEKMSEIIDGVVSKGANQVGDIQFVIDAPEKLREEARLKAIENAKERANKIAQATGLKLGKIVSFSEGGSSLPPIPVPYSLELGKGGEEITPQIEKGSLEITVNVNLTFELK